MSRTTADNVKAILIAGKQYDDAENPSLSPFIDTASALVDSVVTCAAADGTTLTDATLELIERWLAAHFYLHADQPYQSKSTSKASASFQGQTGMQLASTQYGQTAMLLDTSGCLAAFSSPGKNPSMLWLGKPPSSQIDYVDRD